MLKKETKNCVRVLEQIANRRAERNHIENYFSVSSVNSSDFNKVLKGGRFKYVLVNNSKFSASAPNNFIYVSHEEKVFRISEIVNVTYNEIEFEGHFVLKLPV